MEIVRQTCALFEVEAAIVAAACDAKSGRGGGAGCGSGGGGGRASTGDGSIDGGNREFIDDDGGGRMPLKGEL